MADDPRPTSRLKRLRVVLWLAVAVAILTPIGLILLQKSPQPNAATVTSRFGGSFTLVDGAGHSFSSEKLAGRPYAIYFGFTRCGDVCPTTLSRLVALRKQAASAGAMRIVFVTIDPEHDGPAQVGQYAGLFNAPIIGLTGSRAQIDRVKKQYGIFAEPVPHAAMGKEMAHTATVLLFDRNGQLSGTISPTDPDSDALAKIKRLAS